jgi:hypothetical protein
MEASDVWALFGAHLHQDFFIEYSDTLSGIRDVLENFSLEQKEELHRFLMELCCGGYTLREKMEIWEKSGASFFVEAKYFSRFLMEILNEIEISMKN